MKSYRESFESSRQLLRNDASDEGLKGYERERLHDCHRLLSGLRSRWKVVLPWASTAILAISSAVMGALLYISTHSGTYESGFRTELGLSPVSRQNNAEPSTEMNVRDLGSAIHLIQLEQKTMRSDDDYKYVGKPSLELDTAWSKLLTGMILLLKSYDIY